jgi:hypothetical protein
MLWLPKKPGFRRETVRGETLTLGDPDLVTYLVKSTFEGCDISINCPTRGIHIDTCIFRDCTIRANKPQSDHQFFTSTFERCKFIGKFPGCEFGFRIDLHGKTRGTVADCDFREAILDLVSFNNCDMQSMKLPGWPHFTILNPVETAARIPNPLNCPELALVVSNGLGMTSITKGLTYHAPELLNDSLYEENQLRELLAGVKEIVL